MPLVIPGERLGGTEMAAAGQASAVVSFGKYKYLTFYICVPGYSSNGTFALRFGLEGGAIDTGARYRFRNLRGPNTTGTAWQAGVAPVAAQTRMELAHAQILGGRWCVVEVMNRPATIHTAFWRTINESASLTAHPETIFGDGAYVSVASGQITSAQLVVNGGDLSAGSGFAVTGHNPF